MNIYLSAYFVQKLKKLKKKNPSLTPLLKKRISQFKSDPTMSSLRLHRLKGNRVTDWSFSIERKIRIVFTHIDNGVLFIDIGTHDEVYR